VSKKTKPLQVLTRNDLRSCEKAVFFNLLSDFVLLCPNCHKAVHIYMKKNDQDYESIKMNLKSKF